MRIAHPLSSSADTTFHCKSIEVHTLHALHFPRVTPEGVHWITGEVYVGTLCQRVSGAEGMAQVGI